MSRLQRLTAGGMLGMQKVHLIHCMPASCTGIIDMLQRFSCRWMAQKTLVPYLILGSGTNDNCGGFLLSLFLSVVLEAISVYTQFNMHLYKQFLIWLESCTKENNQLHS